jgi:hypothetical protein
MGATDKTLRRDRVIKQDLRFGETLSLNIWENGPFMAIICGGLVAIIPQLFEVCLIAFAWIIWKFGKAPFPELPTDPKIKQQKGSSPLYTMGMEINAKKNPFGSLIHKCDSICWC